MSEHECYECGYSEDACVCIPFAVDDADDDRLQLSRCPRCQEHYCDCH